MVEPRLTPTPRSQASHPRTRPDHSSEVLHSQAPVPGQPQDHHVARAEWLGVKGQHWTLSQSSKGEEERSQEREGRASRLCRLEPAALGPRHELPVSHRGRAVSPRKPGKYSKATEKTEGTWPQGQHELSGNTAQVPPEDGWTLGTPWHVLAVAHTPQVALASAGLAKGCLSIQDGWELLLGHLAEVSPHHHHMEVPKLSASFCLDQSNLDPSPP